MPSSLRERSSKHRRGRAGQAGEALRRLVDLVSHRSGLALATMNDAAITLPQVLLLSHVERRGTASPSELAEAMHASLPAVSQMIDRLVQQGLLDRTDDPVDRRRKSLATTAGARSFMRKLAAARSTEYELGLASAAPELLAQLTILIGRVVEELDGSAGVDGRRTPRARREAK
jgi:DNA-binding MarR family transcriptional regulator